MAYIHQISFIIDRDQLGRLDVGSPLQKGLSFLRVQLPDFEGFITSRARYSIDEGDDVLVVVESVWDDYESLEEHRASGVTEEKLRDDFGDLRDFRVREFVEVD
jgi:hypothetical protein